MHQVIFPLSFIYCSICKLVNSFSMMFIIFPLSVINSSTGIMINTMTLHFVLNPRSFVFLLSKSIWTVTRNFENSLTVFHFDSIEQSPITFVNCSINILKFSISMKLMFRYFWLFLLWRLFYYFFFNLFFRTHFYNLSFLIF